MDESPVAERPPRDPALAGPIAIRLRRLRLQRGLSLKKLGALAADPSGRALAASFIHAVEAGTKVPGEEVALRLARALGDEQQAALYSAWSQTQSRGRSSRADHLTLLQAWQTLRFAGLAADAEETPEDPAAPRRSPTAAPVRARRTESEAAEREARLSIPVLEEGVDPGDGVRPARELVINTLSLDPNTFGREAPAARDVLQRLRRPFAFLLSARQAGRGLRLLPGAYAIVSRETSAWSPGVPAMHDAFALRVPGGIELVSGAALAGATPPPEALMTAGLRHADALRAQVIGKVAFLLPGLRE